MSRIDAIHPAQASGKARQLLDAVPTKLGLTPDLMRTGANSPAVLRGALASGSLDAHVPQQIALAFAATGVDFPEVNPNVEGPACAARRQFGERTPCAFPDANHTTNPNRNASTERGNT